jgi:hypothetical protein
MVSSEVANMKCIFAYRKRAFLNPASTGYTSYIHAVVESSHDGEYQYGGNLLYIADCTRVISLEFFIGNARARRLSLKKINLLIEVLTSFRDALAKEIASIEQSK